MTAVLRTKHHFDSFCYRIQYILENITTAVCGSHIVGCVPCVVDGPIVGAPIAHLFLISQYEDAFCCMLRLFNTQLISFLTLKCPQYPVHYTINK